MHAPPPLALAVEGRGKLLAPRFTRSTLLRPCRYNLFCRTIPTIQILLNGTEEHLELYAAKVGNLTCSPNGSLVGVPTCVARAATLQHPAVTMVG